MRKLTQPRRERIIIVSTPDVEMSFKLSEDSPWVGEYAEDDAFRFFEAISPTHGLFGYGGGAWEFEHFIFRGHGSDDFLLLPGAFRTKTKLLWNRAWREVPFPSVADQVWAEVTTLDAFFAYAIDKASPFRRTRRLHVACCADG